MTYSERIKMANATTVSFGSRILAATSMAWRALWPYGRMALLWIVAIAMAPAVYLFYVIAYGAASLHRREAGIAKTFVWVAMFCAAAVVAICAVVEKGAGTAGCWLSKKVRLPYPKKAETVRGT
jgi:hypothetical protein